MAFYGRGGTLVSIVEPPSTEKAKAQGIKGEFFIVEPNRRQLEEIGRLIDTGRLGEPCAVTLADKVRRQCVADYGPDVAAVCRLGRLPWP